MYIIILFFYYFIEESIWLFRIENFVAVHHCYEIIRIAQVNNVVSVAREHNDALDFISTYLIIEDFTGSFLAKLNQTMTGNNDEQLPLGMMPMLTFGYSRLRYIRRTSNACVLFRNSTIGKVATCML